MRRRLLVLLLGLLLPAVAGAAPPALPEPLPPPARVDPRLAELGRKLFFDRRLSGDGTMNCATCHTPQEQFADGQPLSAAYPTNKHWRHTPSLINVGYLQVWFWDGRSVSLEDQAKGPIHSSFEMNLNLDYLVAKLREIPAYRELFATACGAPVSQEQVTLALAAFERTLVMRDSPFDRALAGDGQALSAAARRGAEIFFGPRGGCSVCHAGALLSDQQFHNVGVGETDELRHDPQRRATRNFFVGQYGLEPLERDPGRFALTRRPQDLGAFRTPPLRQVAETGPYMHNGSLPTLEAVIAFIVAGGGSDPNRSPLLRPLALTAGEQADLLAFLRSLSGTPPQVNTRPPEF